MDQKSLIETRRRRLVQAKLDSVMRRTGGNIQMAKLDNGALFPVELSEDVLTKALIKLFEEMIYDTHRRAEAESIISGHYADCIGRSKLTPDAVYFMDALIETLAEEAMKKRMLTRKRLCATALQFRCQFGQLTCTSPRSSPVAYWCTCKAGWSLNVALLTTR